MVRGYQWRWRNTMPFAAIGLPWSEKRKLWPPKRVFFELSSRCFASIIERTKDVEYFHSIYNMWNHLDCNQFFRWFWEFYFQNGSILGLPEEICNNFEWILRFDGGMKYKIEAVCRLGRRNTQSPGIVSLSIKPKISRFNFLVDLRAQSAYCDKIMDVNLTRTLFRSWLTSVITGFRW